MVSRLNEIKRYEALVNAAFKKELMEFRLEEKDNYVILFSIAVQPMERGQGLGTAIIEDLIDYAKMKKFKGIKLQCDSKMLHKLVPFYNSFGFHSDDSYPDLMRMDFIEESK